METKRAEFGASSAAAVVVADGKITAVSAVGGRKIGEDFSVEAGDKFHIGSNTKATSAAHCALLVKEKDEQSLATPN